MSIRVQEGSRLRFGEVVKFDGVEFWDVLDLPDILEQRDDLVHTVVGPDRMDLLAYRYYRDARLWWVIAAANDIEEVPTSLNIGDELRIPSPRYVTQVLFKKAAVQRR